MSISYLPFLISVEFEESILFNVNPIFVFRSVLGKEIRKLTCVNKDSKCNECNYYTNCTYNYLFESVKSKDSTVLPGLDKSCHPFIIKEIDEWPHFPITKYSFFIVLLGNAISYYPYLNLALQRAGDSGVLFKRTKFTISGIYSEFGNKIKDSEDNSYRDYIKEWSLDSFQSNFNGEIMVSLNTPLRFKKNGRFCNDFSATDFFICLKRRMLTVLNLYGSDKNFDDLSIDCTKIKMKQKNIHWIDYSHYSARQKYAMKLGGLVGSFIIEGVFEPYLIGLLDFAEYFNAGKNISFGFGNLKIWKKESL